MKTMLALAGQKQLRICGWMATCVMAAVTLGAQAPAPRIQSEISNSQLSTLKGSLHPLAQAQFDAGRMPADTRLNGMTIVFNRSAAQQADLDALMAAQQNPASPLFHQWLTPDQFAARFGMADSDLEQVKNWLQQQGFSIDSVARSRNMIRFSGTTGQVEQAFQTQMHYYQAQGARHFAPSTALSLPAALAPVVVAVRNLNDFRPRPMHIHGSPRRARPSYTFYGQNNDQYVLFAPGDINMAYDMNPLLHGSFTGTGQSIAIMGQSAIQTTDIQNFQSAANLAADLPTTVLVPDTGNSTLYATGDEGESDLDLEWSSAMAPGANIIFVYAGNGNNAGVFDSMIYTIEEDLAPIISISYGSCEPASTKMEIDSLESILAEGPVQGQSIFAASGDKGSTTCQGDSGPPNNFTTAQQEVLAVSYPASSAFVTGVGGTEITAANDAVGTYWSAVSPSTAEDSLNTLLKYIPEVAWNDDLNAPASQGGGLSASGGGASIYVARPTWQKGTIAGAAIPSGSFRLVPDVALYASPNYPGYLYCTSDQSDWSSGQMGSCGQGQFYDPTSDYFTVAGGTSFAAPIFAGMVAIINQKENFTGGQGLMNPTLYSMAADSTTYSSAFHDVTSGNNYCTAGTTYCSSSGATEGFKAAAGYDEVTGLGSVDLNNLVSDWAQVGTVATLAGSSTMITATSSTPTFGVTDTFTITVTSTSGTPSGNVTLSIDGGGTDYSNNGSGSGTGTTATAALSSTVAGTATATYQTSFSAAGIHEIVASYPANGTQAASSGVVEVTVGGVSSGKGTIKLAPSNTSAGSPTLTVAQGASGTETITVTPAGGYTGTVLLSFDTSNDTALANLCSSFPGMTGSGEGPVVITGTAAATTTLTLDTNASDCAAVSHRTTGMHRLGGAKSAKNNGTSPVPAAMTLASLLLIGFLGRYSRKLSVLAGFIALVAIGLTVSACGGGGGGGTITVPNPPTGTYTITVTGTDSSTSSITANTTFTFTIQ